jgi:outer membrane protein assembly factor BamB
MKTVLLALLLSVEVFAANWPQFRGPEARGVDDSKAAATSWNVEKNENVLFKTAIPGLSHSSPIIWGDRLFVLTAVGAKKADLKVGLYGDIDSADDQSEHEWRLIAIDRASGKSFWNQLAHKAVPRVKRHTKSSHANSTPATDGERIVAIVGSEGLFCFDMTGKLLWKRDIGPMDSGFFRSPSSQWGFASSPVIHDGKVVVQCDVQKNSFLAVFNLKDGRELWRTKRTDVPTWSTPAIATVDGKTEIFVNGWHHIGGYDFATGAEIWKLDGGGDIPVPTPIVANGFAYFTSAHGGPRATRAIRLQAKGDITPPEIGATNQFIAWSRPREGTYMQTPILVGDYIYACMDNGVLSCINAKTGELAYSERLTTGNQGFTASPVSDGRNLFFPSELGNVHVVPATGKFSVSGVSPLGETCMASPALANGILYFRTRDNVIAIGN